MIYHDGPFFSGTLFKVAARRSFHPEFKLLDVGVIASGDSKSYDMKSVTTVYGDGTLEHDGVMNIHGQSNIAVNLRDTYIDVSSNPWGKEEKDYVLQLKTFGELPDPNAESHLTLVSELK